MGVLPISLSTLSAIVGACVSSVATDAPASIVANAGGGGFWAAGFWAAGFWVAGTRFGQRHGGINTGEEKCADQDH